ncbi:MAG: 50S ribosomal protein L11 methyltransferase [Nitrospiraceae bacterium]
MKNGLGEAFAPTLVLANVDRRTLLVVVAPLARYVAQGARLLLSGLLLDQRDEIQQAYAAHGAYLAHARERDGWLALELIAMEGCDGT